VLIDDASAVKSLKDIDKEGVKAEGKLSKLSTTGGKIGIGIAGAGVAAGAALVAMTGKIVETTGAIQDSADRAGTTAEEYQKWSFAAEQCGMSTETLESAMIKSQKSFTDAKSGSEGMSEAYAKLGVDIANIGTSSEAFDVTMTKLAGMSDETERNALANDIFGKSYSDLTPLLNEGGTGIEALKQKAVDLGGVMSNEAVASGEQFGDTLDQLTTAGTGVFTSIGTSLIPILQTFADWLIANMPTIKTTIKTVFDAIVKVVGKAYDAFKENLLPIIKSILKWVQDNWPLIQSVMKTVFDAVVAVVGTAIDAFKKYLLPIIKTLVEWIGINFPIMKDAIKTVFEKIVEFVQNGIDKFNAIKDTVSDLYDSIKLKFQGIKDTIEDAIDGIKDFLDFDWEFPKLKMPHFSFSGTMNPLDWAAKGLPKVGVEWYAKGGIFSKPTLFNTPYGLKGVGDASSPEVVAPLNDLNAMISKGINEAIAPLLINQQSSDAPTIENIIYFGDDVVYKSYKRAEKNEGKRLGYTTKTAIS